MQMDDRLIAVEVITFGKLITEMQMKPMILVGMPKLFEEATLENGELK